MGQSSVEPSPGKYCLKLKCIIKICAGLKIVHEQDTFLVTSFYPGGYFQNHKKKRITLGTS